MSRRRIKENFQFFKEPSSFLAIKDKHSYKFYSSVKVIDRNYKIVRGARVSLSLVQYNAQIWHKLFYFQQKKKKGKSNFKRKIRKQFFFLFLIRQIVFVMSTAKVKLMFSTVSCQFRLIAPVSGTLWLVFLDSRRYLEWLEVTSICVAPGIYNTAALHGSS